MVRRSLNLAKGNVHPSEFSFEEPSRVHNLMKKIKQTRTVKSRKKENGHTLKTMCTAQNAVHFETVGSRGNAGLFHTDVETTFVPENAAHFETIGSTGNAGLFQDAVESSNFDALCLAFQNFKDPFTWIELKSGNRQKKSDRISQAPAQFKTGVHHIGLILILKMFMRTL